MSTTLQLMCTVNFVILTTIAGTIYIIYNMSTSSGQSIRKRLSRFFPDRTSSRAPTTPTPTRPTAPPLPQPGYIDDSETQPPSDDEVIPATMEPGVSAFYTESPGDSSQVSDASGSVGAPRLDPDTLLWQRLFSIYLTVINLLILTNFSMYFNFLNRFSSPEVAKAVTESYQTYYTGAWT